MQVLRLTTPKLHPKEQRPLSEDPGTEKRWRPPFAPDELPIRSAASGARG